MATIGIAVALLKVLFVILLEYRSYFPADFDSAFLGGRRSFFQGWYRVAFYSHLLCGPVTILIGGFLLLSGRAGVHLSWHRRFGKTQLFLVIGILVPSGLAMSARAFAGPIATAGFASLSLATAFAAIIAAWHARRKNIRLHRRWAMRCLILLCSPLLLRLITGAAIVMNLETPQFYQLNAWASWTIPLVFYEVSLILNLGQLMRGTCDGSD